MKIEIGTGFNKPCLILTTETQEEIQAILSILGKNAGECGTTYTVESVGRAILTNDQDETGEKYEEGRRVDWMRLRFAKVEKDKKERGSK